ncbi:MAG: BatA and WFA domain-containing protein [Nanoarchaeota archaeon]|nr:BatA and WFA domain-containing protein [Nanoarchaeota archaeon]
MALPFGITNALGSYAFLALIPFLILYLIKPKPKTLEIPSLMFFMKAESADKHHSFLRIFRYDWIFWIQLISLLFLATAVTAPYLLAQLDTVSDTLVFVIDASASSQVSDKGTTRFTQAITGAEELLGKDNTIILVKGSSAIGIKNRNAGEARAYLKTITPTDTRSKIGEAILLGGQLLQGKGRIVVFSDLLNTEGIPPALAADIMKSKGIPVDLFPIIQPAKKNWGIIDLQVDDEETKAIIKNYDTTSRTLTVTLGEQTKKVSLAPQSLDSITFTTPPNINTITIEDQDDFPIDNEATIVGPQEQHLKIAYITNQRSLFLPAALESIKGLTIDYYEPPIFPDEYYDLYILQGIDQKKVIGGSMQLIKHNVATGASAIIYGAQDIRAIDFQGLLPVGLQDFLENGVITIDQLNSITRDLEFGNTNGYYESILQDNSISLASVNNNSIIALRTIDKGKTLYYGILDDMSDFTLSPSYPIFWKKSIQHLTNQRDVKSSNIKTGELLTFEQPTTITTPTATKTTQTLYIDQAGVYTINEQPLAANLLSDAESNINGYGTNEEPLTDLELTPIQQTTAVPLETYLLWTVLLLLLLETILVKQRGDL